MTETAFDFLARRQSYPAKLLTAPAPDRAALAAILGAALRVPDHGKLEPWRVVVLGRGALDRLAGLAVAIAGEKGMDAEQADKGRGQFARSVLCVAVVAVPRPVDKIPAREQMLSAGALCLGVVNAATAAGWGACWLTGWPAYDRDFVTRGLDLAPDEWIAGFVHLGTPGPAVPDRPRPDPATVIRWMD